MEKARAKEEKESEKKERKKERMKEKKKERNDRPKEGKREKKSWRKRAFPRTDDVCCVDLSKDYDNYRINNFRKFCAVPAYAFVFHARND